MTDKEKTCSGPSDCVHVRDGLVRNYADAHWDDSARPEPHTCRLPNTEMRTRCASPNSDAEIRCGCFCHEEKSR